MWHKCDALLKVINKIQVGGDSTFPQLTVYVIEIAGCERASHTKDQFWTHDKLPN